MRFCQSFDIGTGPLRILLQFQKAATVIYAEPECSCPMQESQTFNIRSRIIPVAIILTQWLDQPDILVITDCL